MLAAVMRELPWCRVRVAVENGRVPVVKATALVMRDGEGVGDYGKRKGDDLEVEIPLDISIDGPGHSGISSTSFTRILNRKLPSLRPMVLVLKEVLRRKGLNDPFEGGMGSYGLVLMVTFLLLKQRRLLNRQEEDKTRTSSGDHASPSGHHHHHHHNHHIPGGQGDKKAMAKPQYQSTFGISAGKTILRQAGLGGEGEGASMGSKWEEEDEDDPLFGFTFYIQNEEFESDGEEDSEDDGEGDSAGGTDEEAEEDPPAESSRLLLGQLLLDFFQLFGEEFDVKSTGFSVRGGGFTFPLHQEPPHPLCNDPLIIEDPLNATNNVGRNCWRVNMVKDVLGGMIGLTKERIARWGRAAGGGKEDDILEILLSIDVNVGEKGKKEEFKKKESQQLKPKRREDLL
jgi:hypothetical protein